MMKVSGAMVRPRIVGDDVRSILFRVPEQLRVDFRCALLTCRVDAQSVLLSFVRAFVRKHQDGSLDSAFGEIIRTAKEADHDDAVSE